MITALAAAGVIIWRHTRARRGPFSVTESGRLEHRMLELAAANDLLRAELDQAQKMEAMGRMASGVAHDFNNLLTVINGYTRLCLEEMTTGDPARQHARFVLDAGARAAALTTRLLSLSRTPGEFASRIDLNQTVRDATSFLRRVIPESIDLICIAPGTCQVDADVTLVEQIVMNLCLNARDAVDEGGQILVESGSAEFETPMRATAGDEVPPGKYAVLTVSDNGAGMDELALDNLFEPFFTTKEEGKGCGLGLSTAHDCAHQVGGFITVHSEPGQGTTFEVYLPLAAPLARNVAVAG